MHPDTVNRIVGKVSSIKSKHKSENNDSKKLVHSMVEGFVGHPVNFDDHKEMINKVREKVEEVKMALEKNGFEIISINRKKEWAVIVSTIA